MAVVGSIIQSSAYRVAHLNVGRVCTVRRLILELEGHLQTNVSSRGLRSVVRRGNASKYLKSYG
jgi:hypothetical protein